MTPPPCGVYDELRAMAVSHLRREPSGHALQPTALAHEAFLKLVDQTEVKFQERVHFLAICTQAMRRILVDHARGKAHDKRSGGRQRGELNDELMSDLKHRGLLDSTLIVWMGEFGRTPKINPQSGRDHFPAAWSTVMCGGGIKGGQVIGKTSPDGMKIDDRPVSVQDLFATMCKALGLDPLKQNLCNVGRPIRLADPNAKPITELL